MMGPEGGPDAAIGEVTGDEPARILTLISTLGNRELLTGWIADHPEYELVGDDADLSRAEVDCLILDPPALFDRESALIERKHRDLVPVPYLLLVEETDERAVRETLRDQHPDLWETVDGVVGMPVSKYRLGDWIETLLRLRNRSRETVAQRRQLRAIRNEHTGHGVIIADPDETIRYVNQAFETQSGYDRSEVIGETPDMLKSGAHDEAFYEELRETIAAGEVWQGQLINERKDGEQYVVDQTIAPVTDSEGAVQQIIAVNHEITELKQLEEQLREQREQLAVLNRILRHDIRNDLGVVLGWAETLESHVDAEGEGYLQRIIDSGRHMKELTESARDLSAGLESEAGADLEATNLQDVLIAEVDRRRETHEDAVIEVSNPPPAETTVRANEMLASVFRNLINNAVQHNDRDTPHVWVSASEGEGTCRVEIADDGPGISDELKERVFQESSKGLQSDGTGVGLFLVRSLMDTYEGDVWIEDNDPRGTVFVIELPTVTPDSAAEQDH